MSNTVYIQKSLSVKEYHSKHCANLKRDQKSQQDTSNTSSKNNETLSPRKKNSLTIWQYCVWFRSKRKKKILWNLGALETRPNANNERKGI